MEIQLTNLSNQLRLSIRNDGSLLPSIVKANPGLGLRIMNYRAHLIGASLEVSPGEREGAVVICSFPWSKQQD